MDSITGYTATEHKAKFGKKNIIVRNLLPIFANEDEKRNTRRDVEDELYRIFSKYTLCTA